MNVLVTGGAGFIGSHIAEALLVEGHRVVIIDDLSSGLRENIPPRAKFIHLSLTDPDLLNVLKREKLDAVCHVAAKTNLRESLVDPKKDAEVNILALVNLLEACKNMRLKRFVFSSTGGALYGAAKHFPVTEDAPTHPISPYGVSKLAGEKYLYYYHAVHGLPVTILRYSNVYGPRQEKKNPPGALVSFVDRVMRGETITINGSGNQTRDFVFVGDVARANVLSLKRLGAGFAVCNISGGEETRIKKLLSLIGKAAGVKPVVAHAPAIRGEVVRSCLSNKRARSLLKWRPQTNVERGITKVVDHLRGVYTAEHDH